MHRLIRVNTLQLAKLGPQTGYKQAFHTTSRLLQAAASNELAGKPSFARGLFLGKIETPQVFPYPDVMTPDSKETLSLLVDPVTKFFNERNDASKNDETSSVPPEITEEMKQLGLFGLQVPGEYGGIGLTNTGYARMVEIVGSTDLGVGIYLGAHQSIGFKGILLVGNEKQKAKYLPKLATGETIAAFCLTEPGSGSDANSIKTRATLSEDKKHFILNGGKIWISNGGIAEIFTVFAQTQVDDKDNPGKKKDKVTAFIVERSFGGVSHGLPEKKMGIKCSNTAEVHFDNVKVPIENVLGEVGGGFKVAMAILNNGRFGMGAALTGTMKKVMAISSEHAVNRDQFGQKIKEYGLIKEKFARMAMKCYAAESMAYMLSANMDRGSTDYQIEAAITKVFASEAAWFVCDEGIQVLGGLGFMKAYPLERVLRDLRIFRIFEGTNDILRMFVALEGIKTAGAELKSLQKNPLSNIPKLLKTMASIGNSNTGAIPVPNELKDCAAAIEKQSSDFGVAITKFVMAQGKNVINQQLPLKRVAECVMDLYSMAAVTSRASQALKNQDPTAQHQVALAKAINLEGAERVSRGIKEILNPNKTSDSLLYQISDEVFKNTSYVPTHPLNL